MITWIFGCFLIHYVRWGHKNALHTIVGITQVMESKKDQGRERAREADSNGRPTLISLWILAREGMLHVGWINTARLRAKFTNPPCMIKWKGVWWSVHMFSLSLFSRPVTSNSTSLFSHFSLWIPHSAVSTNCFWLLLIYSLMVWSDTCYFKLLMNFVKRFFFG